MQWYQALFPQGYSNQSISWPLTSIYCWGLEYMNLPPCTLYAFMALCLGKGETELKPVFSVT